MKKLIALLIVISIACIFGGCGDDTSKNITSSEDSAFSEDNTSTTETSTSAKTDSQETEYDLPTTDELIENFENNFTLSNIKNEADKVAFSVSTGETIFGFTDSSDKVTTFQVFASGSSVDSLLSQNYHFYPLCHFISGIKGETVTVSDIIEVLLSAEPTVESGSVSNSMTWKVKKEGIQYELVVTEYLTNNYCTMDIYARIY